MTLPPTVTLALSMVQASTGTGSSLTFVSPAAVISSARNCAAWLSAGDPVQRNPSGVDLKPAMVFSRRCG